MQVHYRKVHGYTDMTMPAISISPVVGRVGGVGGGRAEAGQEPSNNSNNTTANFLSK